MTGIVAANVEPGQLAAESESEDAGFSDPEKSGFI